VGKPEGKKLLGRLNHELMEYIKLDLGEIGFGAIDWVHLAQDRY
jgi:hypothetical protein